MQMIMGASMMAALALAKLGRKNSANNRSFAPGLEWARREFEPAADWLLPGKRRPSPKTPMAVVRAHGQPGTAESPSFR